MPAHSVEVHNSEQKEKTISKIILVTGGTGMVGQGIKQALNNDESLPHEKWIFVGRKDCDLTNLEATRTLFAKYRPTHVINLAAMVGGLEMNSKYNLQFFLNNMEMAMNVLKCCNETNIDHCISCLSTCIYPDYTTYPIDETMLHNGMPHPTNFGFAFAKRMIDVLNRGYNQEHNRKYVCVIPCSVFGPYDNFNLNEAHVIPALINKIYLAKKDQHPLQVYGSGRALRQFIYSIDLGRLFVWAIRNYEMTEPIILSVGEEDEISIADIVIKIVKATGFTGEVNFDTTKPEGQFKKTASNKKMRQYLPNFKFTPFDQALKETVDWFADNYDIARH